MVIDWHAHHTAPEIANRIQQLRGKNRILTLAIQPIYPNGSRKWTMSASTCSSSAKVPGFTQINCRRIKPSKIVTQSNAILAERIALHRNRLMGITALSLKNIDASVKEIERTASQGFRAVLLYPHVDGEMLVDQPVMDPIFARFQS